MYTQKFADGVYTDHRGVNATFENAVNVIRGIVRERLDGAYVHANGSIRESVVTVIVELVQVVQVDTRSFISTRWVIRR